jgi:hypothetical protein
LCWWSVFCKKHYLLLLLLLFVLFFFGKTQIGPGLCRNCTVRRTTAHPLQG